MKRIKATKTNIEKLEHPTGKKPDRYFATNCSALCIFVQPQPSLNKSYYGSFGKTIIGPDGKQKSTGRYKYICRVGDKPLEAVMNEVRAKLKDWKKDKSQSGKTITVTDLVKAFIAGGAKGFRIKKKGGKLKYKNSTSEDYISKLSIYILLMTSNQDLIERLTYPTGNLTTAGSLKDVPLDKLNQEDIEAFHNRLESTPTVANRVLAVLSVCFAWDSKRGKDRLFKGVNPCLRIEKFPETKDKKFLEIEKVLEIRNYIMQELWRDPHFLALYMVLLEVGEREVDIFELVWNKPSTVTEQKKCSGWINFKNEEIHLTDSKDRNAADVGLTVEAIQVLKKLQQLKIDENSKAGFAAGSKYVFPRPTDPSKPINYSSYRKKLQKFNYKFGLAEREHVKGRGKGVFVKGKGKRKAYKYKNNYCFKHLRKTFVTHFGREHGVEAASERMRHSSPQVTRDHYFNYETEKLRVKHVYNTGNNVVPLKKIGAADE